MTGVTSDDAGNLHVKDAATFNDETGSPYVTSFGRRLDAQSKTTFIQSRTPLVCAVQDCRSLVGLGLSVPCKKCWAYLFLQTS